MTTTTTTITKTKAGKQIPCKVRMLDDQELPFHIDPKAIGQDLVNTVCKYIDLLERDYFGLEYLDRHRNVCWLELDKPILKQVTETKFSFCVKFYTPDPGQLEEEFTRYLFALQIKRDLALGTLLCSDNTASLLASYIVQAEIGDYLETYNNNPNYLNQRKYFPHQTPEHEIRIMNFHKNHLGQHPADADLNLLDTARKVELYGIKMHTAKDHEQVNLNLSVAHMGILVFQNITKINTFSWAKIRKLSFKRKKFLIKLQPEGYGYYKDTVEFYFDTRDECKNFWKKCIEYHAFFRCVTIQRLHRSKTKLLSRGSSFRYHGRTQKEIVEYARECYNKNRTFTRSYSNTRTVAPVTNRTHRSPVSTIKPSDTVESVRHHRHQTGIINDTADVYQQVYHDDSSTHGSRTLDSRFSRDKYDLSDEQNTDEDEDELIQKTTNGVSSSSTRIYRSSEPFQIDNNHITQVQHPIDQIDNDDSLPTTNRRHISGTVNSHRSVPPLTSSTPPRRLSNTEQQILTATHRLNLGKQIKMIDNDSIDMESPTKISSMNENMYSTSSPLSILTSPYNKTEESAIDESRTRTIPVIHEYRSPRTPVCTIESRSTSRHQQSPSRSIPSTSYRASPPMAGIPRLIGSVHPSSLSTTTLPTSVSSTMIIPSIHDRSFFICKELLMTERTYKKDIEVVAEHFRRELMLAINHYQDSYMTDEYNFENETLIHLSDVLFTHLLPIYTFHAHFLRQLEQRISIWETRSIPGNECLPIDKMAQQIGDLMMNLIEILPRYERYIENYDRLLTELEYILKHNRRFEIIYKEFESEKFCYLSFISFLIKPLQRLLHYEYLFEKLLIYYKNNDYEIEYQDCYGIFIKIQDLIENFAESLTLLLNRQKLIELQRDLIGVDNLSSQYDRQFIREGCLQKLSRKGYQQRMFFLFSDVLLYCARSSSPVLQFKLHGELSLRTMTVEDSDEHVNIPNSITIYTGNRSLLVVASSPTEKKKWLHDLKYAIENLKINSDDQKHQYSATLKSNASSENLEHSVVGTLDDDNMSQIDRSCVQHRANTTMHVCWHRNLSVSIHDHRQTIKNQLSGYLLRKFKNSNGWQKLWVIFTNFSLFFYKTYQDDYPLASLPLLGYRSSLPSEFDGVNKDFVFKLQFKNHVYFFRAESQYAFDRWIEVVSSATTTTSQ
ncbi:unnamed protein product [Adineta steineri]|uniref:Moesin/ezrin/radixin homolog 1 n=1 Tax=Adineta steineri TaxID=433720 RepID=A0A814JYD8_9BILA|nr:unnamed protein product [Adineta steineri]CAF3751688.1 unnamed protein product [Adineta steineri]